MNVWEGYLERKQRFFDFSRIENPPQKKTQVTSPPSGSFIIGGFFADAPITATPHAATPPKHAAAASFRVSPRDIGKLDFDGSYV